MRKTTAALLSAALLAVGASPAGAATNQLSGTVADGNGDEIGTISLTVHTKKGVAKKVSNVKLRNVKSTCVQDGETTEGDRVSATLRGSFKAKRKTVNGTTVWAFSKKGARGGGFKWNVSGLLNKKGTELAGGQVSSADVGGGDNADCSIEGGFTAER